MTPDQSIHKSDAKTIAVLVAILAGLVGLIGLSVSDPSTSVDPIRAAHAGVLSTATNTDAEPVKDSTKAAADENWGADDSARGTRSDAAH